MEKYIHPGTVTKASVDEGVDGFIRQDVLGFDKIFVQAKAWKPDYNVGRPEIQKFVGAVLGQGASKGAFFTTSEFSTPAREFADRYLPARIILIDGRQLTELMMRYHVGVSIAHTYDILRVDMDYFSDEDGEN